MLRTKKILRNSVREYRGLSLRTPLYVTLESIMECIIPFLMANLIDYGIDKGDMSYIWRMGLILVGCTVVTLFFGALAGKTAAEASAGYAKNLRHDMYYHLQDFAFSNIDRFSTASLVTRLTTDITNVQLAFQMRKRILFRAPVMLIFSMVMAFTINPELAAIFLCVTPFLLVGLILIMRHAHPIFERVFKTYDKLNQVVQENLRGIRVVKSFVREKYEEKKFGDISESIYKDFSKAEKTVAFNMPLMQLCIYTVMLLISWFGARMIVASGNDPALCMTTGELMSLISYAMQILMSLMMVSMVFVMLTISRASEERIIEVLEEKPDIQNPENPVKEVKDGSIRFENVNFSYSGDPNRLCLKDADLTINAGEVVGILGGTGASKSTLVQLIPRLYDVTSGRVLVGGVDVRDYDIETLRDAVAMVLQKNVLFSGTIKENLRWGDKNATDEEMVHACKLAQADDFIRSFPDGYDTHIEQGGSNVSGGQRQRLCIARALLKKPKILIMDDSTSAVDTQTDALIRKALATERPEVTKIIIAQRVSSLMDADKIIVMDGGEIVAVGKHEELIRKCAIYREVYQSQNSAAAQSELERADAQNAQEARAALELPAADAKKDKDKKDKKAKDAKKEKDAPKDGKKDKDKKDKPSKKAKEAKGGEQA